MQGLVNKQIQKDLARSRTFSAQEALEYGLIDRIIRPPRLTPDPSKVVASELKYYWYHKCLLVMNWLGSEINESKSTAPLKLSSRTECELLW